MDKNAEVTDEMLKEAEATTDFPLCPMASQYAEENMEEDDDATGGTGDGSVEEPAVNATSGEAATQVVEE